MLRGGALSPCDRRRAVRNTEVKPKRATTTTSRIQPATGVMLPLTRSSTTLLEIEITPPTAPLSTSKT